MAVKIPLGFSPIHDLPIGLDSSGMMTSAPYGVGSVARDRFGHVYSDDNNTAGNPQIKGKLEDAKSKTHHAKASALKSEG